MIRIERALGLATLQDLGAHGLMHEGVPPGGALVPDLLRRANALAHNREDALAIEIMGALTVSAETDVELATDEAAFTLARGERATLRSDRFRARYLAARGGFRGTRALLCAGGAPLRAGDRVEITPNAPARAPQPALDMSQGNIRVVLGPERFGSIDAFFATAWRVRPDSDRVGTRLAPMTEGATISRSDVVDRSRPMVRGAIEVPPDGNPIVLGPEHPTTGGYPVIAVIASEDVSRFFAIPLGGVVRFVGG